MRVATDSARLSSQYLNRERERERERERIEAGKERNRREWAGRMKEGKEIEGREREHYITTFICHKH